MQTTQVIDLTRRIGKFSVSDYFIDHVFKTERPTDREVFGLLMQRVIIVHAEHRLDKRCMDYVAMSADFAEVPLGQEAPTYYWKVTQHQPELPEHAEPPCANTIAPPGHYCTRELGHDGPCAAWEMPAPTFTFEATLAPVLRSEDTILF